MKKFLCALLTVSICMSVMFSVPVFAAGAEWEYTVWVGVSEGKNSKTKEHAIRCKLTFDGMDEVAVMEKTQYSGGSAYAEFKKLSRAPWTLDSVEFENTTKDGFKMYCAYIDVRRTDNLEKTSPKRVMQIQFFGKEGDRKSGIWIDQDDGHPKTHTIRFNPSRTISDIPSFGSLGGSIYLQTSGESSKEESYAWDGGIHDDYAQNDGDDYVGEGYTYNCLNLSDPPTYSLSVSGQKGDKSNVTKSELLKKGFSEQDYGFKLNRAALAEYMNAENINRIDLTSTLTFSDKSTKSPQSFVRYFSIKRPVFSLDYVKLGSNYYTAETDNYFYNNSGERMIKVTGRIKTGGNAVLSRIKLTGRSLLFSGAYLKAGDEIKLEAQKDGKKATSVLLNGCRFTLEFPYEEGMYSGDAGLTLELEDARLNVSKVTYRLWDETKHELGCSQYFSTHKIDSKNPSVALTAINGTDLSKWNKTVSLASTPDEDIFVSLSDGASPTRGYYKMQLKNGGNAVGIYGYGYTEQTPGAASAEQKIPAVGKSTNNITLALRDRIEGEFDLVLSGQDYAGNPLSTKLTGIKLDNKPPVISVEEQQGTVKGDGSKGNTYKVSISDASETGKMYYKFTQKSFIEAKEYSEKDIAEASPNKSGEMETLEDKWAFIEQKDAEKGVSAYLGTEKGKNFHGRMVYFGVDAFGNKTDVYSKDINIENEDSVCSIIPSNPDYPRPSYDITVTTNKNNTVWYRWKNYKEVDGKTVENYITEYKKYDGTFSTAGDSATKSINGTHIFECKIVTPSGNSRIESRTYVFDNEGPSVNITAAEAGAYKSSRVLTVYATDASEVASGTAKIVNADGSDISGLEEFSLNVTDGVISQSVNVGNVPSGAYALKVTAKDRNGLSAAEVSKVFFIRNAQPSGTVDIVSGKKHDEHSLLSDGKIKLSFDITENFANAKSTSGQSLYFRTGTVSNEYGEWQYGGEMKADGDSLNATLEQDAPEIAVADGKNLLFVQYAVCTYGTDTNKIDLNTVRTDEIVFYHDNTAPKATLVINDAHTNENITGMLYVRDNLSEEITAECENAAVKLEKSENEEENAFIITVSESVDTIIKISDEAGNTAETKLVIKGIDKTPPTAEMTVSEKMSGARKDASATVTVKGAADAYGENAENRGIRFALIPTDKYSGDGKIADEFFRENIADSETPDEFFRVIETRADNAEWEDESDITYNVIVAGKTGSWYLGVRAADSLGNVGDIVFGDVISAEDAELTEEHKVSPMITSKKAVVSVNFNMPVYVLPQDKITGGNIGESGVEGAGEIAESANFELARQNAAFFSQNYSFAVTDNGTYSLYTVDDIGRTKLIKIGVSGVRFGAVGGIKATTFRKESDESLDYIEIKDGEMTGVGRYHQPVKVEVEPVNANTNLMPLEIGGGTPENGLSFNPDESVNAAEGTGYSKIVYDAEQILDANGEAADVIDRIIEVCAFDKSTDMSAVNPQDYLVTTVVDNIDNTEPKMSWSVSPNIYTYEEEYYEGKVYRRINGVVPTPGNVEFTFRAQDKETGINKIVAFQYLESVDETGENYADVAVPLFDSSGNAIDYSENPWTWDGSGHTEAIPKYYNEETGETEYVYEAIPIKVEYFGDADPKGIKTLKYTFTKEYYIMGGWFVNGAGVYGNSRIEELEGINTLGAIYSMEIEESTDTEAKDYKIKYYYEDANGEWQPVENSETYYKNAKAVIEKDVRAEERGLYVSNNGGSFEKLLNSYENSFMFELKDKYGYRKSVPVSLENFDEDSGTVEYKLSNTEKTNKPVTVEITAADEKSGVGKVTLLNGSDEIRLTSAGSDKYIGQIEKNGTYSIVMYDNVGNKAVKNFNVKNIDTVMPKIEMRTYSTKEITSRPVTVTLTFSKPNVRITKVGAGTLTEADYSVNYSTSVITFTKSGTIGICFADEYGNEIDPNNPEWIAVSNIDKTPPSLKPNVIPRSDGKSVAVEFEKDNNIIDTRRELSDILVTYGGMTKRADYDGEPISENGKDNRFVFYQSGGYTFKVHDEEGLTSYLSVEIDIDTTAPKVSYVSWSYDYEEMRDGVWQTGRIERTITPADGKVGYIIVPDENNKVTNGDVTVNIGTDAPTRLIGTNGEYTANQEKVFGDNGLFIFNMEKSNGLSASYGFDVEVIDKTPPVIDLLDMQEMVFYENPQMGALYSKSLLDAKDGTAFKAYDVFRGKTTDLTANVEIDWGEFNADNLNANRFDASKPYTITYRVSDKAHNIAEAKRTVRLVGMYDTVALVNGMLPDFAGRSEVRGDSIKISLANFSGMAYVSYKNGLKTMGQMKREGEMLKKNANGEFEAANLAEGWYTFYVQTDKRDYFTLQVYLCS